MLLARPAVALAASAALLGIWAHWGPQSVPRQGDWYAVYLAPVP
jgi:hypothetical protein